MPLLRGLTSMEADVLLEHILYFNKETEKSSTVAQ